MLLAGGIVAAVAGLIHGWIFLLESVWFDRPAVHGRFGVRSEADARIVRGFAFNQGFYNLFLAIGAGLGLVLMAWAGGADGSDPGLFAGGRAIAAFSCASMAAAGVVLLATDRRYLRASSLQIVPGGLAAALLLVG